MTPTKTVDLTAFKEQKRAAFQKRLFELCSPRSFPKQDIDQVTGAAINPQGAADLLELFQLFGITGLDPNSEDFDTVLNTWYQLTGSVFSHLRTTGPFIDKLDAARRPTWPPVYLQYIDALLAGERGFIGQLVAQIVACEDEATVGGFFYDRAGLEEHLACIEHMRNEQLDADSPLYLRALRQAALVGPEPWRHQSWPVLKEGKVAYLLQATLV